MKKDVARGLFLGIFSFLLAGCAVNNSVNEKSAEYTIDQNARIPENNAVIVGRFADTGPLTFCFYELSSKHLLEFSANNDWQIKNVPEGIYWLGMIKKRNKDSCPTVWHDLNVYFGIKKDEVVYIGDFSFNGHELNHSYKNDELNKFIKRGHRSLRGKVKTRRLQSTN